MRGEHVLLIEPDPFLAGIYAAKFRKEHVAVEVAETLSAAQKSMEKHLPKVIVLDPSVDQGEGLVFLETVRKDPATYAVPVVILTDLADPDTVTRALARGATEYLIKGHFVPIEAVRKVKKVMLT